MTQEKDRTQKSATEMTFEEFCAWATGFILFGIGSGDKLQVLVHTIVNSAAINTV